jgi:hypothetical protein
MPVSLQQLMSIELRQRRLVLLRGRAGMLRLHAGPVAGFGLALACTLPVALLQGPKIFYYDSGNYWNLARTFSRDGHFSLLSFESTLRGYALPLTNYGLQALARGLHFGQSSMARLFNAFIFALIGGVLAPSLAELAWPTRRWGLARRMALVALLIVFWSGYLDFPLSDFPALAMALLALLAVSRADRPGWMLLAGGAGGLAIDIRAEYLLLGPILVLLVAWSWVAQRGTRHRSSAHRLLCLGLFALGFVAVSLPQSLASHRHYGTWSFVPGSASTLTAPQLEVGMEYQLHNTYVGPNHPPGMFYVDPAGARLLREQRRGGDRSQALGGVLEYAEVMVGHPVFMAGLLVRHLINGLDQRFSTPYVEHLHSWAMPWRRLAGFLIVFMALVRVLWPRARRSLGPARWRYPGALLLCCATSWLAAVEQRYLLPADLLGYMLLLTPGWPSPLGRADAGVRRLVTPAVLFASYLVSMAVVWRVVSATSAHLRFG